jgi:amino acid transporter
MILGVILYLRLGQVTGQAGLYTCLVIIGCAKLITTLTALSMSSLATNTRVRGGGAYYIISRSLGVEYGSAIGPVFFLALASSVALYVIGFTEALYWINPELPLSPRATATLVNTLVFACVYIGAAWTINLQFAILAVMLLSLVSFFSGALPLFSLDQLQANTAPSFAPGQNAFTMFALFFPAVTGFMAGANLSGDLEDPGKAIPRGTLLAILVTGIVYVAVATTLAGSQPADALVENTNILGSTARWPLWVAAGILAATLSSALSSMMGAPRVLHALARDNVFPPLRFFRRATGRNREPRRAIVLTFLLAQGGVLAGDLNTVAPLITMFFLITYGAINLACFYESITGNPSYRPAFPLSHWSIGLAGAASCFTAMFLVAPAWAIAAIAVIALLIRAVQRQELRSRWGDVHWGNAYERARRALLRLEEETYYPKSWRPSILAIRSGRWTEHHRTAEYAAWLQGGRGILTLAQVEPGDIESRMQRRSEELESGRRFVQAEDLDAFYAVVVEERLLDGLQALLQSYGIGNVRPNTVLFDWSTDPQQAEVLGEIVDTARAFECSAVALQADPSVARWSTGSGSIDVWWHSRKNGALMLILAHLLSHAHAWRNRPIRLLHAVEPWEDSEEMLAAMHEMLLTARIRATPQIIVAEDPTSCISWHSRDAAVTILGMDPPEDTASMRAWYADIQARIENLGEVVLVSNAGNVRLGD